jgi:ABC-type phosphate/phosphonate transport system permease subunit
MLTLNNNKLHFKQQDFNDNLFVLLFVQNTWQIVSIILSLIILTFNQSHLKYSLTDTQITLKGLNNVFRHHPSLFVPLLFVSLYHIKY